MASLSFDRELPKSVSFENEEYSIQLVNSDTMYVDLKTLFHSTTILIEEPMVHIRSMAYGYTFTMDCFDDEIMIHYIFDELGNSYKVLNTEVMFQIASGLMLIHYLQTERGVVVSVAN